MHVRSGSGRPSAVTAGLFGLALATTLGGCLVADTSGPPSGAFNGNTGYGGSYGGGGYGGGGGSGGIGPQACAGASSSNFKVAWTIQDASGAASTCDGVAAVEMDLDLLNLNTNVDYHGVYACSDMMGTSCALPAGPYSMAMRLRDAAGTLLSELAPPDTLYITSGQTTDLGTIPFAANQGGSDAGTGQAIKLAWTIDRAGAILTCADAGATTVEVQVGAQKFPFPCDDGSAQTPSITVGTYPVTIRLLDAQGTPLSVTQTMNVALPANLLLDLGTVPFDVI
jgi:hypothetical protein